MIGKVFFIKIFLVLRTMPQRESFKKKLEKKSKLFLKFPYLLGVWVGDKRHFEPYTLLYKSLYHNNEKFSRIDDKNFSANRGRVTPRNNIEGRNLI